jgi:hypothetical protein
MILSHKPIKRLGERAGTRTQDPLIKSQMLSPAELRAHEDKSSLTRDKKGWIKRWDYIEGTFPFRKRKSLFMCCFFISVDGKDKMLCERSVKMSFWCMTKLGRGGNKHEAW